MRGKGTMENSIKGHYLKRMLCILVAVLVLTTTIFVSSDDGIEVMAKNDISGRSVVKYAKEFIGNPYVYGGNSLTGGTDCSGFVKLVYSKYGKTLPRSSYAYRSVGKSVSYGDAEVGDILVYSGHVALYAGNDKIVHAANPRKGICISPAKYDNILSVRRVV